MEDALNFKVNGRRPHFFVKWKRTSMTFEMEDDHSFFLGKADVASPSFSWAWHSSAPSCFQFIVMWTPRSVNYSRYDSEMTAEFWIFFAGSTRLSMIVCVIVQKKRLFNQESEPTIALPNSSQLRDKEALWSERRRVTVMVIMGGL